MTFHVVCHDCEFEEVHDSINGAWPAWRDHRFEEMHDVEWAQVD